MRDGDGGAFSETRVADELPVAIWLGKVPSGEVVYTNAAFRQILGIDPPEGAARGAFVEPYGVHTTDGLRYPEEDMPFERVIAARATVTVDDLVIHRHDGRKVNLRVFAKPIFDASGTMTHVLEAFTDITREVEAERARLEGERRLASSQRLEAIGQLVAGIAHDFNNLLTVSKLVVSRLRSGEVDPARREALGELDVVTDSAIGLIKNLIGFARHGKRIAAPVSVEAVVCAIAEIAGRTFDKAIAVRLDLSPEATTVFGDASELEQVVMNLVLNARDAIQGNGEVVLRTRVQTFEGADVAPNAPGRYVLLEVADTGAGIDPAIVNRIFEPYFTTKMLGPVKGTGLGLSTVHGIVRGHGGFIEAVRNEPRGTIMRVALPARDATPPPRRRASHVVRKRGETGAPSPLVLVVDDEPLVRESTAAALRHLGCQVVLASDGVAALDAFGSRQAEFSAVVLDLVMPGLNGREVLRSLHAARPSLPVVVVTGCVLTDEESRELLASGVRGWIAKPFGAEELERGLAEAGIL